VDRRRENQELKMQKILLKDTLFNAAGHKNVKNNGHFGSLSGWELELASN